ncbi:hypothetical protein LCGC14_2398260, partial [marine sediment metagenome]
TPTGSPGGTAEDWPCWRGPNGDGKSLARGIRKDWSGGLRKLWEVNYLCLGGDSAATYSAPAVKGDKLVIPGREGGRDGKDLTFCFNANTGRRLWRKEYSARTPDVSGTGPRATLAIDGGMVYTYGKAGDLLCRDLATGRKRWHRNLVQQEGGKEPGWGMWIMRRPSDGPRAS